MGHYASEMGFGPTLEEQEVRQRWFKLRDAIEQSNPTLDGFPALKLSSLIRVLGILHGFKVSVSDTPTSSDLDAVEQWLKSKSINI